MTSRNTTRAAVVHEPGASPVVEELALAPLEPTEVLIRVESAGICHTDVAYADGDFFPYFPAVLGHEIAGTVETVGEGVHRVGTGQRVVFTVDRHCGTCEHCEAGHVVLCETDPPRTRPARLHLDGEPVVQAMGGFAEAMIFDQVSVTPVPDGVSADVAAVMGCAVASGAGAVFNVAQVVPGESLGIVGVGGVGLSAVMAGCAAGADPVIAIDPDPDRRKLALELGATHAVEPQRDLVDEIVRGGPRAVVESAGTVPAMQFALEITRRGGRMVLMGAPPPSTQLPIDVHELLLGQRRILTCLAGDIAPNRDFDRLFSLYLAGRLDVDQLISGHVPLDEIARGFDACRSRRGLRTLVRP